MNGVADLTADADRSALETTTSSLPGRGRETRARDDAGMSTPQLGLDTPVERFAARHDADLVDPTARWYSDRIPLTAPGPGEQYAFQVDLDQCSGCKSCVAACHSLNGLDAGESWRSVGLLVGEEAGRARTQTVPSGCHHCLEPACLAGCPTNAYEKDPITGIVAHLDDQCFGCGYCELTCPYEVPKLNHRLGIVRKCDMCAGRLAAGEAPACVQACPTSAISITLVSTVTVSARTREGALVPGAPASSITAPTTQYVGSRSLPDDARGADHHALHLSTAHPPLAVMLVLTQLSVGAFVATLLTERTGGAWAAAAAALVALSASVLHLGRPLIAYRAVLGLRHSWLSREIVAFGAYAALAAAYAIGVATDVAPPAVVDALGAAAAVLGVTGVVCSALIYVVTRRTWWQARYSMVKFALTAAGTGPLLVLVTGADARPLGVIAGVATLVALADEAWLIVRPGGDDLARTARLLRDRLRGATVWRFGLALSGALLAILTTSVVWAALALAAVLGGALIERYQFFVASVSPRMPGGFRR